MENILKKPYIHFYTSCVLVIIASVQLGLTIAILFFTFKVVKCIGKNFGEENTQTHFPRRRRRLQNQGRYKNRVKSNRNIFDIPLLYLVKNDVQKSGKKQKSFYQGIYKNRVKNNRMFFEIPTCLCSRKI